MTELWFRNPVPYARELKAVTTSYNIVWDIAYLAHHDLNPFVYMNMIFGLKGDWKYMVMYRLERQAKMYDNSNQLIDEFPIFDVNEDDPDVLFDLINDHSRIVLVGFNVQDRKQQLIDVNEIVKTYPDVKFHIFNGYSYYALFGLDFYSADYAPRERAAKGEVVLPNGSHLNMNGSKGDPIDAMLWIQSIGFKLGDLRYDLKARIRFNIVSAYWAAEYFKKLPNFQKKISYIPISNAVGREVIKTNTPLAKTGLAIQEGDKRACDFCSLWSNCRYYREGSVCMMPDSDYKDIANLFGTRDSFQIASGVSKLLAVNVERISEGREAEKRTHEALMSRVESAEEEDEEHDGRKKKRGSTIDPELTKLIDSTIKQGIALANLHKVPENGRGRVTITLTGSEGGKPAGELMSGSSSVTKEVAAMAIAAIEEAGTARGEITRELVEEWIRANVAESVVIEGSTDEE